MSFDDEITAGFSAANDFAGEPFTLSLHGGLFMGVFRGDSSDVNFDGLQGYDSDITNAVSVAKLSFPTTPPAVDEILIRADSAKYGITSVESADASTWDLGLKKINDG